MKISFVLPYLNIPSGGFRVVYEYADLLSSKGHEVTIYYPLIEINGEFTKSLNISNLLYCIRNKFPISVPPTWFKFDNHVKNLLIPEINDKYIDAGDAIFATAFPTANMIKGLSSNKGVKYYLIQHDESIMIDAKFKDIVAKTYQLGHLNIIISKWLQDVLNKANSPVAAYIPNGIDLSCIYRKKAIEARQPSICMMAHTAAWKGLKEGIEAFAKIHDKYPTVKLSMFGTAERLAGMPAYIEYYHSPTREELCTILNDASIFVSASWIEGFGLPGAEAMAAGCALVTTDSKGCRDYAQAEITAIMVAPQDSAGLAKGIMRLLENDDLRVKIAQAGNRHIQQFTWNRAGASLEKLLYEHLLD